MPPFGDIQDGPLGAVFGSRAHLEKAAAAQRSKLRNFLTWGFHLLVTLVAGGTIRDTQCGFKVWMGMLAVMLDLINQGTPDCVITWLA